MMASLGGTRSKRQRLQQKLCDQHGRLMGIAWSWCHDRMLAEDLVQETLTRALSNIGSLREETKLEAWVTRVMLNLYRDMYRKHEPVVGIDFEIESEGDSPDKSLERHDAVRRVYAAMAKLSEGQRQVVSLVDIAEFSYADTAGILDVPMGTVMSRLFRARKSLREVLERDERRADNPPLEARCAVG